MSHAGIVEAFAAASRAARQMRDLRAATIEAAQALGFDYIACMHHLELDAPGPGVVRMSNYPEGLVAAHRAQRWISDDPVVVAAQRSVGGFAWAELGHRITLSSRQRAVLASAAREGLGEGYTVPAHVPGELAGSCSFATRAGRALPAANVPVLPYLGGLVFEAARGLARAHQPSADLAFQLSDRQLDCIVLMTRGATARQAAARLGVKPDTVEKHIGAAKRRSGARSMAQLVARGLFDGQLTFFDLLRGKNDVDS
jgi:LuxR family transcriptional regulator, quorum-sensing system regulator CciR